MAHHKRKRPKVQRAGCLMCKPWKAKLRGEEDLKASERRRLQPENRR